MSRGWTATTVVALIMTVSLFGACSSESSKPSTAELDKRSAAAIKAEGVRKRAAAAARRAKAAAKRARLARIAKKPKVEPQASTSPSGDLAEIQRTVRSLNAAFRASVVAGIMNSEDANHWVGPVYSGDQCVAFEMARGQGVVAEELLVHPESLVPAPGWVDPVIGQVPPGRIYRMTIDEIQTLVTTGQRRGRTLSIHVTVKPDGNARLFLRCA